MKFSEEKTQVYSMPNVRSKQSRNLSGEIEKISGNNFELKNQTDKDKKDNRTFRNLSQSSKNEKISKEVNLSC